MEELVPPCATHPEPTTAVLPSKTTCAGTKSLGSGFFFRQALFVPPISCVVERFAAIISRHCGVRMDALDQGCNADDTLEESWFFMFFIFRC